MTSIVSILTTFYNAIKTKFAMKEDVKQPDWNQNDSTAMDYIKNRTGGYDEGGELLNGTYDLSSGFAIVGSTSFIQGINYTVIWDDTEYTCTAQSDGSTIYLGDMAKLDPYSTSTGEPFLIYDGALYSWDQTTHTIVIKCGNPVVFPSRYLPNSNILNGKDIGSLRTVASKEESDSYSLGTNAFAEGANTAASGHSSHAEGASTTASGTASHAEAYNTTASGNSSHAEGNITTASGDSSHAEGRNTISSGEYSHAEGIYTKASSYSQHVQGKFNIEDSSNTYADIIGNGTADTRSNASTVDWNGNAWYSGDVYVGSTSGTNKDEGSKKLATEEYADSKQVQPDYNQNDSTAADYIKNRPFYAGDPVETVIIPETTVTFSGKSGLMAATWPENFDLVDGQTYNVSWDGTEYVCTGILFNNIPLLGNLGIAGAGENTGEPFVFLNQGQWLVYSTESATEHVIGIKTVTIPIVQIDEKYLPVAGNDTYGVVKSDTFVKYYNFGARVSATEMNAALSEFENGKVHIVWDGCHIIDGNVISDTSIRVMLSDYHFGAYTTYNADSGYYNFIVGGNTDAEEIYAKRVRMYDDSNNETGIFDSKSITLTSSTADSTKKFKIRVDDTGTISATEVS